MKTIYQFVRVDYNLTGAPIWGPVFTESIKDMESFFRQQGWSHGQRPKVRKMKDGRDCYFFERQVEPTEDVPAVAIADVEIRPDGWEMTGWRLP